MEHPLAARKTNAQVVRYVARALLAGGLDAADLTARIATTLGREWKWLRPLAERYIARFAGVTRPRLRDVVGFLKEDTRLQAACRRHGAALRVAQRVAGAARMLPVQAAAGWGVPEIATAADLAAWLRITPGELEWFADLKGLGGKSGVGESLRHYRYRVEAKRSGGVRLIEAPKERLKTMQRRILTEILDRVPAHEAVHGFVRGLSIRTFAAPHAGRAAVLRLDLKDFFPSMRRGRVQALFRTLGYPEAVADLLGGLTTTRTPRDVLRGDNQAQLRALYGQSHLAQGAPSSPALANACCYRLDCRLSGLARATGVFYTRYADDLAFSGGEDFLRGVGRSAAHVRAIVMEEGLSVNFRKTRVMRQGVRQHLAGLVVNEKVNVGRAEFDRLKAVLTNCVRHGARVENRERRNGFREHLEGRVAFVGSVNAGRGEKLKKLLDRVKWPD